MRIIKERNLTRMAGGHPNPKSEVFEIGLSCGKILKEYTRSIPPVYRIAMATMAAGRKMKTRQADQPI
jgi:hypothetical protein